MSEQQIFCPQCGQRVELSTEYKTSFCPYCGCAFDFLNSDSNEKPAEKQSAEKSEQIAEKEIPASPEKQQSPSVPPKRKDGDQRLQDGTWPLRPGHFLLRFCIFWEMKQIRLISQRFCSPLYFLRLSQSGIQVRIHGGIFQKSEKEHGCAGH